MRMDEEAEQLLLNKRTYRVHDSFGAPHHEPNILIVP
jgi:hypothetical protein